MKEPSRLDIIKWWLGWFLIDYVPGSWSTKYETRRYAIFKWCFNGFEQYVYWYANKWGRP